MTLSTTTARTSYIGSGSSGPFPYPFKITAATDLDVYRTSSTGNVTPLAYPSDYTVTGVGDAAGGSINLTTALTVGQTLELVRDVAITQPTSLRTQGTFLPESHEDALDRITMIAQDHEDAISRSLRLAPSLDPATHSVTLTPETGKALVWQSSTSLGNSALDAGAIAIPGGGRTVATLTAYLLNNAVANAKDFGAKGDAVTDDTAAIQAAINAAADYTTIVFPPGTYKITGTLYVTGRHGLVFEGYGRALITASAPTFDGFIADTTSSHITWHRLRLLGASVVGDVGSGTREFRSAITCSAGYCQVLDCEISRFNNGVHFWVGFWYAGFYGCVASGNYIHDCIGATSGNGYGVYTVCPHSHIEGNRFENVGRHDAYCSGSDTGANWSVVKGNTSIGNGVQAIAIYNTATYGPVTGVSVTGNTIRNCVIGIRADVNTWCCTVTGNTIENASAASLQLDGGVNANEQPQGNVFTGNTIRNSQSDTPILLTNASRTLISGNTIHSNGKLYGMFITSSGSPAEFPTGNYIGPNIVWGNTSHAVFVDVTCIDTIVDPVYGATTSSISNDRDNLTVTSTATPTTVDLKGKGGRSRPVFINFNPASPITVTNFTNAREGQVIICHFQTASAVTVTQANAILAGGVNFVSTSNDTISLILRGVNWVEIARSVN